MTIEAAMPLIDFRAIHSPAGWLEGILFDYKNSLVSSGTNDVGWEGF